MTFCLGGWWADFDGGGADFDDAGARDGSFGGRLWNEGGERVRGFRSSAKKNIPQGLRPGPLVGLIGTAEAVPCYRAKAFTRAWIVVRVGMVAISVCALVVGANAQAAADGKTAFELDQPRVAVNEQGGQLSNGLVSADSAGGRGTACLDACWRSPEGGQGEH